MFDSTSNLSVRRGCDSPHHIYIYADKGTSLESIAHTENMLKQLLSDTHNIHHIKAPEIIEGTWTQNATLLMMPGGADLSYCRKLNGAGNQVIKNFVQSGGAYLGICAGAYYGSRSITFRRTNQSEIRGDRELAFFPGKAIGPLLAPYSDQNKSGVRAAQIDTSDPPGSLFLYFNGGCYFEGAAKDPSTTVLGSYRVEGKRPLPAIVHMKHQEGSVILSGVHFEYDPFALDETDPYIQGIIPFLKQSDVQRRALTHTLLTKLGLSL